MAVHSELTPSEVAARLAIRALFDAYAHCADRRQPTYVLDGRDALTPVFADLNRYKATTHFNEQSTVEIDGNRVTGESYTIAHHVYAEVGRRKIMIASLRYLDTFAKIDRAWFFAERNLIVDWSEARSM